MRDEVTVVLEDAGDGSPHHRGSGHHRQQSGTSGSGGSFLGSFMGEPDLIRGAAFGYLWEGGSFLGSFMGEDVGFGGYSTSYWIRQLG